MRRRLSNWGTAAPLRSNKFGRILTSLRTPPKQVLPLQPFVIQQLNNSGDKLVRDWPAPTMGVDTNYGYMLQWWGMALAALGFRLYAARRAAKNEGKKDEEKKDEEKKDGDGQSAPETLDGKA